MTVIDILMAPQYLNNNHITYYVSRHSINCVYAEQWYVITSDVTWTESLTNKVTGAGVQTSFVHSSIIKCQVGELQHKTL